MKAIPGFTGQLVESQLAEAMRSDADWLNSVLEDEQRKRGELDIREDVIWEQTPEGSKAIDAEKQRIIAGLAPRNVRSAGWES